MPRIEGAKEALLRFLVEPAGTAAVDQPKNPLREVPSGSVLKGVVGERSLVESGAERGVYLKGVFVTVSLPKDLPPGKEVLVQLFQKPEGVELRYIAARPSSGADQVAALLAETLKLPAGEVQELTDGLKAALTNPNYVNLAAGDREETSTGQAFSAALKTLAKLEGLLKEQQLHDPKVLTEALGQSGAQDTDEALSLLEEKVAQLQVFRSAHSALAKTVQVETAIAKALQQFEAANQAPLGKELEAIGAELENIAAKWTVKSPAQEQLRELAQEFRGSLSNLQKTGLSDQETRSLLQNTARSLRAVLETLAKPAGPAPLEPNRVLGARGGRELAQLLIQLERLSTLGPSGVETAVLLKSVDRAAALLQKEESLAARGAAAKLAHFSQATRAALGQGATLQELFRKTAAELKPLIETPADPARANRAEQIQAPLRLLEKIEGLERSLTAAALGRAAVGKLESAPPGSGVQRLLEVFKELGSSGGAEGRYTVQAFREFVHGQLELLKNVEGSLLKVLRVSSASGDLALLQEELKLVPKDLKQLLGSGQGAAFQALVERLRTALEGEAQGSLPEPEFIKVLRESSRALTALMPAAAEQAGEPAAPPRSFQVLIKAMVAQLDTVASLREALASLRQEAGENMFRPSVPGASKSETLQNAAFETALHEFEKQAQVSGEAAGAIEKLSLSLRSLQKDGGGPRPALVEALRQFVEEQTQILEAAKQSVGELLQEVAGQRTAAPVGAEPEMVLMPWQMDFRKRIGEFLKTVAALQTLNTRGGAALPQEAAELVAELAGKLQSLVDGGESFLVILRSIQEISRAWSGREGWAELQQKLTGSTRFPGSGGAVDRLSQGAPGQDLLRDLFDQLDDLSQVPDVKSWGRAVKGREELTFALGLFEPMAADAQPPIGAESYPKLLLSKLRDLRLALALVNNHQEFLRAGADGQFLDGLKDLSEKLQTTSSVKDLLGALSDFAARLRQTEGAALAAAPAAAAGPGALARGVAQFVEVNITAILRGVEIAAGRLPDWEILLRSLTLPLEQAPAERSGQSVSELVKLIRGLLQKREDQGAVSTLEERFNEISRALTEELDGDAEKSENSRKLILKKNMAQFKAALEQARSTALTNGEGAISPSACTQLENIFKGQELLRQMNPLLQRAGEPVFLLFPMMLQGFLTQLELSHEAFYEGIKNKTGTGKKPGQEKVERIAFELSLPGMGLVCVRCAKRSRELFVRFLVEEDRLRSFLTGELPKLASRLEAKGYGRIDCQVLEERPVPERPAWVTNLVTRSGVIA